MTMQLSSPLSSQFGDLSTLGSVWDSVGTEIVLFALFCMGFIICRPKGVQQALHEWVSGVPPTYAQSGRKALKKQKMDEDSPTGSADTPTSSQQFPTSKESFGMKRRASSSSGGSIQQATKVPETNEQAHAHALRIRKALQEKQLDQSLACARAMDTEGHAVPMACIMAIARLARDLNRRPRQLLEALPASVTCPRTLPALLEQAAKAGDIPLMREVHVSIVENGIAVTSSMAEALIRAYAMAGDARAVEVLEQLIARDRFSPSESVIMAVISLCADSKHVQLAERMMDHARQTYKQQVPLMIYSALLKVYSHSRFHEKACDLYSDMKKNGIEADTVIFGSVIRSAVECGRLDLARRLFKESGNPDLLNYMSLIRAAGRERDVPKALALLQELEDSPVGADVTAYNCVLEVCSASSAWQEAMKLMSRMQTLGQVDVISYNTYLKILLAHNLRDSTPDVLAEMRSRGLRPNTVTYNSLLKDLVSQNMPMAWALLEQMVADGVTPDAFTCSILMKGVRHSCNPEDVDRIISLIEKMGITPDEVLVNCLLDASVRLRCVRRITRILDQFQATGVVPSMHTCATLIRAYGHARRLDRALVLWRELIENRRLEPSEEVFGSMVDACLASSDVHAAVSALRTVSKLNHDLTKSSSVISALIKACAQLKEAQLATEVYDAIKDVCVLGKVAYNTLIDCVVRQGDMARATELFRDMGLRAVQPDLITYSTLIKGHCGRGDLEQGLMLLNQMQRSGIKPDQILFNSILDGCAHRQMRTLTEMVLGDMERAGIAPSNFTLSILVKLYGRCNDLAKAFEVVDTLPKQYGFALNAQVYTCLMSACIANGELERALDVHANMEQAGCPADAKTYSTLITGCLKHSELERAVQLVDEALKRAPKVWLSPDTVESVLFMASRRGRSSDLGQPLMSRIQDAGIVVPERVRSSVMVRA